MIKFYSSHCTKCIVLKRLMDEKNINYQEIDDESIYMKVARENRIMSMPFAEINGKMVGTKELQKYIMEV